MTGHHAPGRLPADSAPEHPPGRWVVLDEVGNFRDLGGLRTTDGKTLRPRTVYRSGALDHMSAADDERLVDELRVRTVLDLRRPAEVSYRFVERMAGLGIQHHNIPVGTGRFNGAEPADLASFLLDRLDTARSGIATALRVLAHGEAGSTVIACRLGRDRTGLVTWFLLTLLGVPADTIAADFSLSAQVLTPHYDAWRAEPRFQEWSPRRWDRERRRTRPEVITRLLAGVESRYRNPLAALRPFGVDRAMVRRLQVVLLESDAGQAC